MKTNNFTPKVVAFIALAIISFCPSISWAQFDTIIPKKESAEIAYSCWGIGILQTVSGSGHGWKNEIEINKTCGRNSFNLGVFIENAESFVTGGTLQYKYFVMNPSKKTSLYFHAITLVNNSGLNERCNTLLHNHEYIGEYETYLTFEQYFGFGLKRRLWHNFYLNTDIGFGGYISKLTSSFDNRKNDYSVVREDNSIGLTLRLGIFYYL